MYKLLKRDSMTARKERNKSLSADLLLIIDTIEKLTFEDRKAAGSGYQVPDSVVIGVLKNLIKTTKKSVDEAHLVHRRGVPEEEGEQIEYDQSLHPMLDLINLCEHYLPAKVDGDALRLAIQSLNVDTMKDAMISLKTQSLEVGYTYDGGEAASICKELFM